MKNFSQRRFHKLHEQILLSRTFSLMLGWCIAVALPFLIHIGFSDISYINDGQSNALWLSSIAFILSHTWCNSLTASYPGGRSAFLIAPQIFFVYLCVILGTFLFQINASRLIIITSGIITLIWLYIEYIFTYKYRIPKLAIVVQPNTQELLALNTIDARPISTPILNEKRYDAIVADFATITPEWQRFLTQCALQRTPIYNANQIFESVTGRVRIRNMSENNIGALLPSVFYERIKICLDWLIVILTLPITIPIVLLTAILVKLESPGPVFYTQTRIGQGNKPFTIYKIRSMRFDRAAPEKFAGEDDPRITRVGKIIRKLRIDELPQFLNIIKGDMSLIGPRPEQPSFVEEFDKQIPFYSYRHVVKPGITGWAQVRHGYAANSDETKVKIEHDFYYIKNCSISFDFYIILLTIRTMLTGFGAR